MPLPSSNHGESFVFLCKYIYLSLTHNPPTIPAPCACFVRHHLVIVLSKQTPYASSYHQNKHVAKNGVFTNTPHQCSLLAAIPQLPIAYPNTTSYAATQDAYWSFQEASLAPACIVKPTTSQDVSAIVSKLTASSCPFAIRSRGHAPGAGFANIDNGITIDLTSLNSIKTNKDASVAQLGPGASWLSVYSYLATLDKVVTGGRNADVGVGGLILGGGLSFFSPQTGFSCDSVVNFEVVLASGAIVNANATSNASLFRALKGGGNNFGVVTRVDMRTLPLPEGKVLGGFIVQDIRYREDVFNAFAEIATAKKYDVHASVSMSMSFDTVKGTWMLASAPIYTKQEAAPKVYKKLFAIPNISSSVKISKLPELVNLPLDPQVHWALQGGTYGASAKLISRIFDILNEDFRKLKIPGSLQWTATYAPLPTVLMAQGENQNVMGTAVDQGNALILYIMASWTDSASSPQVYAKAKEIVDRIDALAKRMGLKHDFLYANMIGTDQKPYVSYGAKNHAFLRQVAKQYDPRGVFQKLVPGGYKLNA